MRAASSSGCGFNGIFSQWGTYPSWSPYRKEKVEDAITFHQNNAFARNTYVGTWRVIGGIAVGLTRYSRVKHIRRPSLEEAAAALEQCERWQATLRGQLRTGFVYASDELYVLAGRQDVPPGVSASRTTS